MTRAVHLKHTTHVYIKDKKVEKTLVHQRKKKHWVSNLLISYSNTVRERGPEEQTPPAEELSAKGLATTPEDTQP